MWGLKTLERPSADEPLFVNIFFSFGLYSISKPPTRREACLDTAATNIDSWDLSEVVSSHVSNHNRGLVLKRLEQPG